MPKELLILRHAHAKTDQGCDDEKRDLKTKGKRYAQRMGAWLAKNDLVPSQILTSPAMPALTTAEKLIKAAGSNIGVIDQRNELYKGSSADLIETIKTVDDSIDKLLIVGHNPSIELALAELASSAIPKTKKDNYLPKGTLAHLRIEGGWKNMRANCAQVCEIVYPKTLPAKFPYPHPASQEQRIRPAYYYTQSCAVPYRVQDGGRIQILMVSSSSRKHWVLPKGIHEPGMCAQDSAAMEALEEAGIKGQVREKEIGHYVYEKWDAPCSVTVYPMTVDQQLDVTQWEENSRLRRWVALESAVELIENRRLANIVADLPHYLHEDSE